MYWLAVGVQVSCRLASSLPVVALVPYGPPSWFTSRCCLGASSIWNFRWHKFPGNPFWVYRPYNSICIYTDKGIYMYTYNRISKLSFRADMLYWLTSQPPWWYSTSSPYFYSRDYSLALPPSAVWGLAPPPLPGPHRALLHSHISSSQLCPCLVVMNG